MNIINLKASQNDHQVLLSWWHWLQENHGHRAKLRRAGNADDIMMMEPFFYFLHFRSPEQGQLSKIWKEPKHLHVAALVCGLLARVKTISTDELKKNEINEDQDDFNKNNHTAKFAEQLARPKKNGNQAVMSEVRFQKLQKSDSVDVFYINMSRAINLLNGNVHIQSMVDDILHWYREFQSGLDKEPQNRLAVRWATEYFTTLNHSKLA